MCVLIFCVPCLLFATWGLAMLDGNWGPFAWTVIGSLLLWVILHFGSPVHPHDRPRRRPPGREAWQRMQVGMASDDVHAVLGSPLYIEQGRKCIWYFEETAEHGYVVFDPVRQLVREWVASGV